MKDNTKPNFLQRFLRLASNYGGIPLLLFVSVTIVAILTWCLISLWDGTAERITAITDPTERGLAYIAAAIVFHAFFGRSDVDVKVDGKHSADSEIEP